MFSITTYNRFPGTNYWPNAKWYDGDLNELTAAEAERRFIAGEELNCEHAGMAFRVVFAPFTGQVPTFDLAAIDFRALELRARARQIARRGRQLNNFR